MKTLDVLGLDEKKVNGVVSALNQLLADFQVYYMNLRGLHWNVKGKGFFTLHAKYEELYNDAAAKVDVIGKHARESLQCLSSRGNSARRRFHSDRTRRFGKGSRGSESAHCRGTQDSRVGRRSQ